jgi:F-type H+-transporting ATPase subunit delta
MPRAGTAARRYAEAAFELADREDALDAWRDDLRNAVALVGDPSVAGVLTSPMVPLTEREALVESLLKKRVSPTVLNLVRLLTRRSTLSLLPAIADEYQRLLNQRRGIVSAVVTSAAPLTKAEDAAIRARVATMTGTTVEVQTAVDPALIGGLTVRIGDRLIDASVRGRLERLREQLMSGTRQAG